MKERHIKMINNDKIKKAAASIRSHSENAQSRLRTAAAMSDVLQCAFAGSAALPLPERFMEDYCGELSELIETALWLINGTIDKVSYIEAKMLQEHGNETETESVKN